MEINVTDYLSDNEIKDICTEEVRGIVIRGGERLVSNLAYETAFAIVDDAMTQRVKTKIRKKALEIIDDLSEFSVFRKKDAWGSMDSVAYGELQKAMQDNKKRIYDKVVAVIENYDFEEELKSSDYIVDVLAEVIRRGLREKEK